MYSETADAEAHVRACFQALGVPGYPEGTPIKLSIVFRLRKPKLVPAHKEIWPLGRPDVDNLFKLVADALNGWAWVDDKDIVVIQASKRWADCEPCTEITIESLP